jgi:catechol 2,3-dioxygenase-like lactoylglutathione lyase family enzyme
MKLEFWYAPVTDLAAALALYRDRLGWEEAWREGESTVSLKLPGTDVQLMLDAGGQLSAGPIFFVDSVQDFRAGRGDGLDWRVEPFEIPGGTLGGFADPAGNVVYVMDQAGAGPA